MRKNAFKIESIEESLFLTLIDSQDWNSQKAINEKLSRGSQRKSNLEKVSTVHFVLI